MPFAECNMVASGTALQHAMHNGGVRFCVVHGAQGSAGYVCTWKHRVITVLSSYNLLRCCLVLESELLVGHFNFVLSPRLIVRLFFLVQNGL